MRRAFRLADLLSLVLIGWMAAALVPLEWLWFDPGQVVVSNGTKESVPAIQFDRRILRPTLMRYQVVIRGLGHSHVVCDPASEAFTYQPSAKLPEDLRLHDYWTGGDPQCWPLEPGEYVMETCWTAPRPFWGLVPPKTACRTSNAFTISTVSRQEAEEAIGQTRGLKLRVQELEATIDQIRKGGENADQ